MGNAFVVVVAVVAAGCYGPSFKDCEVGCATGNGCPSGLTCDQALGVCRVEGAGPTCGSVAIDSPNGIDVPLAIDSSDECWPAFTPTNFNPCDGDFPASSGPVASASFLTIDTDLETSGARYMYGGNVVRLIHASTFDIQPGSVLTVKGSLPLLIVADDNVTIAGTLVVLSGTDPTGMMPCTGGAGSQQNGTGSGGAGGGLGTAGGRGGFSGQGAPGGASAGLLGDAKITPLTAGCPGGAGGSPGSTTIGGSGGGGGGGIEISSRKSIVVTASIEAVGERGEVGRISASVSGGAGGGGSGGAIFLEAADAVDVTTGKLCATGGGGGEGGPLPNGPISQKPGVAGSCLGGGIGGTGTGIGHEGGDGGDGSGDSSIAGRPGGDGTAQITGGGGGGGGAGRIRVHTPQPRLNGATIVPPALVQ